MRRLFWLAALGAAVCVIPSVSNARPGGSNTPKPRVQKETAQPVVHIHADATTGGMTDRSPRQDSPLSKGLQALLAYNAGGNRFYSVPADTTKPEEKKEQVKKSDRHFEAEPKSGEEKTATHEQEDEKEGEFWDECFSGCMGVIAESMCSAIFGGDSETQTVAPVQE